MVKMKIQEQKLKPKIGDIHPFIDNNYLQEREFRKEDKEKNLVTLGWVTNGNSFKALDFLGIETIHILQKYKCPHTEMEFFSLVPMYLLTSDLSRYINEDSRNEMIFDQEWSWFQKDDSFPIRKTEKVMIGTGFTRCTNWNDGSNKQKIVSIELENGDELICLTWEWYNK